MSKRLLLLLAPTLLLLPAPVASQEAPAANKVETSFFTLEAPTHWNASTKKLPSGAEGVTLYPATGQRVRVIVQGEKHPNPEEVKLRTAPGVIAAGFGLPIARQVGAKGFAQAMMAFDELTIAGRRAPGCRIMTPVEAKGQFAAIHCFVVSTKKTLILGAVLTGGEMAKMDERASVHQAIAEVYEMLRTMKLKE